MTDAFPLTQAGCACRATWSLNCSIARRGHASATVPKSSGVLPSVGVPQVTLGAVFTGSGELTVYGSTGVVPPAPAISRLHPIVDRVLSSALRRALSPITDRRLTVPQAHRLQQTQDRMLIGRRD